MNMFANVFASILELIVSIFEDKNADFSLFNDR